MGAFGILPTRAQNVRQAQSVTMQRAHFATAKLPLPPPTSSPRAPCAGVTEPGGKYSSAHTVSPYGEKCVLS